MRDVSEFHIEGLFGTRDVTLHIRDNKIILVGPNGLGKSSVVNIFYLFVSRQWSRLLDYEFLTLSIVIDGDHISARRDDISGLSDYKKIEKEFPVGSRMRSMINKLVDANLIEGFFSSPKISTTDRRMYADILGIPSVEVSIFQRSIQRRLSPDSDLFSYPRIALEKSLSDLLPGRALFLPTYRRIEKDMRDVFPDFEERVQRYGRTASGEVVQSPRPGRSATHYIELVSFGMEDVRTSVNNKLQVIRDYSLAQYNNLSAIYLKDVIHGRADKFVTKEINDLTDDNISDILARVSESALNKEDKSLLRDKIRSIQGKTKSKIANNDRFLAHYFTRLVSVHADIAKKEQDISSFVAVCNEYLSPSKEMHYDEIGFSVRIVDELDKEIDLSGLSSGEKQIVSIFAHLYLEEASDQIVIIDEPELSLSVPWQKRFLPDVVHSRRCGLLMAVTHSPFIYENELRRNSVDLRKMSELRTHD